ncbi:hypothetical protein QEN19_002234 [Hanseniaspora menglaensis]
MGVLSVINFTGEYHLMIGTYSINYLSNKIKILAKQNVKKFFLVPTSEQDLSKSKVLINEYSEEIETEIIIVDNLVTVSDLLMKLGREEVNSIIDRVWINLPSKITGNSTLKYEEVKKAIFEKCHKNRIPISSLHDSENSKFHLIPTIKNEKTGIELGISTNKNGCIIGTKLLKEIELRFWKNNHIDEFVENIVGLRNALKQLKSQDDNINDDLWYQIGLIAQDEEGWDSSKFNEFVKEEFIKNNTQKFESASRWLAQMIQYYPLKTLKTVTLKDLFQNDSNDMTESLSLMSENKEVLAEETSLNHVLQKITEKLQTQREEKNSKEKNTIKLVGSGPGSLSMLTLQAIEAITSADLILADKLIPEEILSIIPDNKQLYIAKKFPGNADSAQQQLFNKCQEGLSLGLNIVRLKQGDPYVFGRGGEEFIQLNDYITENKLNSRVEVIPGLSSALVAPLVADIPMTMRNISNEILIMTGTGTGGNLNTYPEYKEERTSIFLMGLHRVEILVDNLVNEKKWNDETAVCIVERAACEDQRVTRTKLKHLVEVVGVIGSRPPGLIVMGPAVNALIPDNGELYTVKEGI